jgi:hypothetical protein
MSDVTPPPEQNLPPGARERIRARLMAEPPRRSWLSPVLAAAAVLAVVAVGAWFARGGGVDDAAPAGGPSETATAPQETPTTPDPPGVCADVMPFPNAGMIASHGTTTLWKSSRSWVVCDTFASQDGGAPTLLAVHNVEAPYAPDQTSLAISENHLMTGESQYFAAGRAFDGVTSISYRFPDGHVVSAVVADGMWSMDYRPRQGPLAEGDTSGLGPIEVTAGSHTFTLDWGTGTCAQVNHGC